MFWFFCYYLFKYYLNIIYFLLVSSEKIFINCSLKLVIRSIKLVNQLRNLWVQITSLRGQFTHLRERSIKRFSPDHQVAT